jgi:hypothetical protein
LFFFKKESAFFFKKEKQETFIRFQPANRAKAARASVTVNSPAGLTRASRAA